MLHTFVQLITGRGSNNYPDYGLVMTILYIDCHSDDGLAVVIPLLEKRFFMTNF